jgi:uncharacterized protein GlcG (DUF336 family)/ketosteroid isomerase-like protein
MTISLELAQKSVNAGAAFVTRNSLPAACIAVVDASAHLVSFARMDGALLGCVDLAERKARTAALFRRNSAALGPLILPGASLHTLENSNGGLAAFGGGVVLVDPAGNVIGAVGVSGGSAEEDERIAQAAAEGDAKRYKQKENTMTEHDKRKIATAFIEALRARDSAKFTEIMTPDVVWTLPGTSRISGEAQGVAGIMKRASVFASYALNIQIEYVVFGLDGVALLLHNTGQREARVLDERLTTVCQLEGARIKRLDTYISDVQMVNDYFA